MKVEIVLKNLFDPSLNAHAIAHSANCFHTMGAGVAVGMMEATDGRILVVDKKTRYGDINKLGTVSHVFYNMKYYYNIYGQHSTRTRAGVYAHFDSIKKGIERIFFAHKNIENFRLAVPVMGCGLAGGDLEDFAKIVNQLCDSDKCYGTLVIAVTDHKMFRNLFNQETGIKSEYIQNENSSIVLNENLILKQGIGTECKIEIKRLHTKLDALLNCPEHYSESPADAVNKIEGLEYGLQALWKFELSSDYHSYWFRVNGCACPKNDNDFLVGTAHRVITKSCPFHGENVKTEW